MRQAIAERKPSTKVDRTCVALPLPCAHALRAFLFLTMALVSACAEAQTPLQPFIVVLDAAHGGEETGTLLSSQLLEKTFVLNLSIRLRSALTARGILVLTTREGDASPTLDARAGEANHAKAGACLVLHATASGSGAHLYTSSLPPSAAPQGRLIPWQTAQAPFLTASLQLASEIGTALGSASIPFTLGRLRLQPMDSLQCPAVTVEIAPLRVTEQGKREQARIDEPAYEQRILNALSAALVQWRSEREGAGK